MGTRPVLLLVRTLETVGAVHLACPRVGQHETQHGLNDLPVPDIPVISTRFIPAVYRDDIDRAPRASSEETIRAPSRSRRAGPRL